MSKEELKNLTPEQANAKIKELVEQIKNEKDPKKLNTINRDLKDLRNEMELRVITEKIDELKKEKEELLKIPEEKMSNNKKDKLRKISRKLKDLHAKRKSIAQKQSQENSQENGDKEETPKTENQDKKPQTEKPASKPKEESKKEENKQNSKSEKSNQQSTRKEKVVVDNEEIARLKEELKECGERRKAYKDAGRYQQEAMEASNYSRIVAQIRELETKPMSLKKVNEELTKLKEELRRCGERRREYKGFDAQVAMEASNYSELVEKIHNLEQQKLEIENKLAKLREELKECGERRQEYKGFDAQVAMEASNYSRIVAQIRELEDGNEKVSNTKPSESKTGKSEESKQGEGKSEESKTGEGKSEEGKTGEGKSEEGKTGEGNSEQGKSEEDGSKLPIEAKEGFLKKLGKGFFEGLKKIGRFFMKLYNKTIGKLYNKYANWAAKRTQLDSEDFEIDETEIAEAVKEVATEISEQTQEGPTTSQQTEQTVRGNAQDRDKTHAAFSSLRNALRSGEQKENEEISDVEEIKKKVEKAMKSESISYGGHEFTGMSKAIVSKVLEGKVLLHSQLLTDQKRKPNFYQPRQNLDR